MYSHHSTNSFSYMRKETEFIFSEYKMMFASFANKGQAEGSI